MVIDLHVLKSTPVICSLEIIGLTLILIGLKKAFKPGKNDEIHSYGKEEAKKEIEDLAWTFFGFFGKNQQYTFLEPLYYIVSGVYLIGLGIHFYHHQ